MCHDLIFNTSLSHTLTSSSIFISELAGGFINISPVKFGFSNATTLTIVNGSHLTVHQTIGLTD